MVKVNFLTLDAGFGPVETLPAYAYDYLRRLNYSDKESRDMLRACVADGDTFTLASTRHFGHVFHVTLKGGQEDRYHAPTDVPQDCVPRRRRSKTAFAFPDTRVAQRLTAALEQSFAAN